MILMNAKEIFYGKVALVIFLLFVGVYPAYSYLKYNHNFLSWFPFISVPFVLSAFYFIFFLDVLKNKKRGVFFLVGAVIVFLWQFCCFF